MSKELIGKRNKPDWIKVKLKTSDNYMNTKKMIQDQMLNTVCEEARCPNIYECWDRKTATIMILGDICTRSCGFCSVKTGKPLSSDLDEAFRVAEAVYAMKLKHVVITSVDRDDLKDDFGASLWAKTIKQIRKLTPQCTIEVLTPDFQNYKPAYERVFKTNPDIFSHNIECVPRISKKVRPQSIWERSIGLLKASVDWGLETKTGMMVGLGETDKEVLNTMNDIAGIGVSIINIGQYLQPTINHLPVQRYVHPDMFNMYKEHGLKNGMRVVESGPLVRSSYHADEQVRKLVSSSI